MDVGLAIFATDRSVTPAWLARRAERLGFESVFFPEHTHIPASRQTPYPMGGDLPPEYARVVEPFVAAMQAAAVTERLRVGTGICLVNQRHPIHCAKSVASVDHLSGGRFLFGIGAGWNREEMEDHGVDPRRRFSLMGERVAAMKAIWSEEEASFSGRDVTFSRLQAWPKPVQSPHPPILVSGNGKTVFDRVLAYGDHWMPNIVGGDETLLGQIDELRARAGREGREIGITINAAPVRLERLRLYVEAGVDRCIFFVPSAGEAEVEARIARIAAATAELGA